MSAIKELQITTNVVSGGYSSGDVGLLYHMNPSLAGTFFPITYQMADFWKLGNVVYDSGHKAPSFQGAYGSNTSFITDLYDAQTAHYIKQLVWDYTGNPAGYAGYYTGAAADSSSGSTLFKCDIMPSYTGNVSVTAKNTLGSSHVTSLAVTAGIKASFAIAWQCTSAGALPAGANATFTGSGFNFPHPCTQISLDPTGVVAGTIYMNYARYDDVVTAAQLNPPIVGGVQIALSKVASGTPDYSIYIGKLQINQTIVDGPLSDPLRYKGLPRWTYKWMGAAGLVGYGAWRGPTGCGYSWLSGWAESAICANGRNVSVQMMQFLKDAQAEYKVQFPAKQIGPFMPRYGRASWEALDTGGYVAGTWVPSTYNKFYYPDNDDWYGYMYRALLSVARYYYLNAATVSIDANAKVVLDYWMSWLDTYIIADTSNWQPPSDFYNDGSVGYTYKPVYAYACIAQACIYKYWVDGDALALKWYRRMLDSLYAKGYQTATGKLRGVSRTTEGQNYTYATCVFSGTGGGVGAAATPFITGGKIHRYDVASAGAGYATLTMVVSGDGSGATGNAYLSNEIVGAFDQSHTGWEISEIFNTYALLINGNCPGGIVNYPISLTPAPTWDISTATYDSKSLSSATQDATTNGIAFSADGTKLYVVGDVNNKVYQYTLSTAWDVSTGSYSGKSKAIAEDTLPWGVTFKPDGTIMYVSGDTNNYIYQYTLGTAWDLSTATYASKSLLVGTQAPKPRAIVFNSTGTTLMVADYTNDTVFQYTLSTAWDLSTGSYASKSKWIGAESFVNGLAFNPTGTIMYTAGPNMGKLFQYTLSTAWDLSTASYASKFFSTATQEGTPRGLVVKPDGTKCYVSGDTSDVTYQYSLAVSGGQDQVIFDGLIALYANNTGSTRPSLRDADLLPLHEYDIDPYHNNSGIENPMYGDTHVRGAMWTETLAPSLYAAVEYGRYTNSWSWLTNQFGCVKELIGLPSSSSYLTPKPRFSLGLADGYTDIIGGEPMETCKRGTYDSAFFTVDSAQRIVIPASMGGGNVTYVRGAWFPATPFNWSGFKASQDTTYGGDQKNYANVNSGATAANVYSGGVLSTVIQLSSIAVGSSLQAYYAYRDGTTSAKGQAMSGWPYLHVDPYQGTANDGDNYLMMALYHAWRVTGNMEYSDAADRIGAALLYGGCWNGNAMSFALSLEEAGGQVGLYSYNGPTTAFSMSNVYKAGNYGLNSLKIQARVWEAQSPAHYAGIGLFPDWPVSVNEPFSGFEFSFCWD